MGEFTKDFSDLGFDHNFPSSLIESSIASFIAFIAFGDIILASRFQHCRHERGAKAVNATVRRLDEPILPTAAESEVAKSSSRLLAACIGEGDAARLKVIVGHEEIEVPVTALRLLVQILAQMAKGNGVTLMPVHAELTTQEAADFLNVSRPFVIGLIEKGELPATLVGTHRRIKFQDLMDYRQRSLVTRKQLVDEMAREDQERGRYD